MSKLYGVMRGAARNEVTRRGHREIVATVASWNGAIRVSIGIDDAGVEHYTVEQVEWHGCGVYREIESGVVGKAPEYDPTAALKAIVANERSPQTDADRFADVVRIAREELAKVTP